MTIYLMHSWTDHHYGLCLPGRSLGIEIDATYVRAKNLGTMQTFFQWRGKKLKRRPDGSVSS